MKGMDVMMFWKAFLTALIFVSPALADDGFYTRFDAAYAAPVQKGGREGYAWRSGFGWRLASHFRLEMTAGYTRNRFGNGFRADQSHGRLSSTAVFANAAVDLFTAAGATPFVFGGIGLSRNRTRPSDIGAAAVPPGSRHALARQGGAGIAFALPEGLTLDVGYAYTDYGRFGFTPLSAEKSSVRQVFAGVRYDFKD